MYLSLHTTYRTQVAESDIPSVTLRLMEGARHRSAEFVGYCDFPATRRNLFRYRDREWQAQRPPRTPEGPCGLPEAQGQASHCQTKTGCAIFIATLTDSGVKFVATDNPHAKNGPPSRRVT